MIEELLEEGPHEPSTLFSHYLINTSKGEGIIRPGAHRSTDRTRSLD
jgi:hypothetical protein